MKNISTLKFFTLPLCLILSLNVLANPVPTNCKTYRSRLLFEAAAPDKKYSENFDNYKTGEKVCTLFDSLVSFPDPQPLAFPGYWDMTGNGGCFSNNGLLPMPVFKSTAVKINFPKKVYGVGTNVFDDFDGSKYRNVITLTVVTSKGDAISVTEDSVDVGDCGFLGITSEDGIVSASISVDDNDANIELDLLAVLSLKDTDNDGVPDITDLCPSTANADQTDSDCDGAGNACDYCDGGDDGQDSDGDGLPDCADWDGIDKVPSAWVCDKKNKDKVSMCTGGKTKCVNEKQVPKKMEKDNFLGPCDAAVCNPAFIIEDGDFGQAMNLEITPETTEVPVLDVFPNPSSGDFSIALNETAQPDAIIVVTDASGKTVLEQKVIPNQQSYKISANGFPKGMYLVKVFEGGKETYKQDLILL